MDKMREEFEQYAESNGLCLTPYGNSYLDDETHRLWCVWLSAWQAAQSVPVVGEVVAYKWAGILFRPEETHNWRRDEAAELVIKPTHSIPAADLATLREKAAEADELRECKALLSEARKSMRQYEADCDEYPPFHHNKLMERIDAAIAQERQP